MQDRPGAKSKTSCSLIPAQVHTGPAQWCGKETGPSEQMRVHRVGSSRAEGREARRRASWLRDEQLGGMFF